ncbi:NADP-dependent 3-hydroxy acid dehydrogenase YdfG [Chitinophaga sp. YR573]|uniref:SDR family NAD(P)-dependent oxidoreductase n=1 Tax=Chitinophaga sp. YR573 TaxID=1881040 RepID=UPI0008B6E80B|nr:SDR family NAD(P)-dependent oxidoreductase [Chitinophaga sp. YR573]SEW43063.1 NADP-dependent 3-hydroxy acid dehydrogenase YdfG [Chitinophaga sp. YR573]
MSNKVWLVTGASKGLGLAITKKLLATGYKVAATSRTADALIKAVGTAASDNFLPLEVSLTDEQSVQKAITDTLAKFGTIDVVVNNAGYGQLGAIEEMSDAEVRKNFDINVFGLLNVMRSVMPHLRAQMSGRVYNISSVGGFIGNFPGWSSYISSKFAVAGLTESFAAEALPFNVYGTVVYPGYFRTDFLSQDSLLLSAKQLDVYQAARDSQAQHQNEINGNQPGDPEKAAELLIKVAEEPNPPVHLFIGADAYKLIDVKIDAVRKDTERLRSLATATDF